MQPSEPLQEHHSTNSSVMMEEGNDEVLLQEQATPVRQYGRNIILIVFTVFTSLIYFLISGFIEGWVEGLKTLIGMSMLLAGWLVLGMASLDQKLTNVGVLTHGIITDQKEETSRFFCRYNRYIRYSYAVDGTTYTNTEAWYDYIYGSAVKADFCPTKIGDQVDIAFLPDHPECSLPYAPYVACSRTDGTCAMIKHVAPSAGSLIHFALQFNFFVFIIPSIVFASGFQIGFKFLIDNDILRTFLGHFFAIPLSCILYYFGWMKPRERRQKFSAAKDVIETPATTEGEVV